MKITISKLGTLRRRRQGDSSRVCAEPHRKIGERSLEILESAIDREDLLVDCAPLRDGGGIEGADGRPSACVEINERRGRRGGESFPHGRVRFRPAGLWPRRRPSGSSVGGESGADASRGFVFRLRRAKVVLADDELRRRRNGGRVVALSVGAEDAVEISDRPGSPWTGVGGRCKRRKLRHTSRAYL